MTWGFFMSLRLKVFLWIGGLFFFGFVLSQTLEEIMTSKSLMKEGERLEKTIIAQDESRRLNIQRYIKNTLDAQKEKIMVIFDKIQNQPLLYQRFAPLAENVKVGTWLRTATLVNHEKWISLIKNTNEGFLTSQIIIDEGFTKDSKLINIDSNFTLCITSTESGSNEWNGPFVAIPYNYEEMGYISIIDDINLGKGPDQHDGYFLLFDLQSIQNLDVEAVYQKFDQISESWKEQGVSFQDSSTYYSKLKDTIDKIQYAQNYIKNNPTFVNQISKENRLAYIKKFLDSHNTLCEKPLDNTIDSINTYNLSRRFDQVASIWEFSSLLASGLLGHEPFSAGFPLGIAQALSNENCGIAIFSQDVLFDQYNISTRKYQGKIGNDGNVSVVVLKDQKDRLFFGGTLDMKSTDSQGDIRRGALTIAIDAREILRNLSLASNAMTFFVSGGQVLAGFSGDGKEMDVDPLAFPASKVANMNSGFLNYSGQDYFFLLLKPYDDVDMNFYILSPKDREFALITVLNTTSKALIEKISLQMHSIVLIALVIVLFILNNIVKHITYPISLLAEACSSLGAGKLHHIELPELKRKKKDEVYTLYHAFKDMIVGLKEKDKVMGVLNKVVSPSIAQEILKGKVHLGGEEKVVTVLFCDIRSFTKLTEKMTPSQVIKMLNTCMTKVSECVDKYQGVIDKYVGDEVMALFGAPLMIENAPIKAIECALEIHKVLAEWNQERVAKQLPRIEMGIGVHTGEVLAGNMGAENRLNYTVLGSNVNLCSRLCGIAKPNEVLITMRTLQFPSVFEKFVVEALPPQEFKGFSEPVKIYKILGPKNNL